MVGVLIRMRLRLLSHSLRGAARVSGFVAGIFLGLLGAAITAGAIAGAELAGNSGLAVAPLLFLVWTLGWLVAPVLVAGSDETLQPEHFSLLPIGPRKLAPGLLVATTVGIAPVMTLLAFAGLLVPAASHGGATFVVAAVGVVLQVVLAIVASRVVVGWLGSAMRSRRGRDLGILLASGVMLLIIPAQMLLGSIVPILAGAGDSALLEALRWLPSGWAPAAVQAASTGQWLPAAGLLAALAAAVGVLTLLWSELLRRRLTTPSTGSGSVAEKVGGGWLERALPAAPVSAVMIKEIRLWWRDNRRRVSLLPGLLLGLAMPLFLGFGDGPGTASLPFAALFAIWLAMLNCGNLYGLDGASLRHTLVAPEVQHAEVRGRQLAWLAFVAPVVALAALVLPAVAGQAEMYPWVLGLTAADLGAASGVVMLLSVFAPFPVPQQRSNPFTAAGQPGCATGLKQVAMSVLLVVAVIPVLAVLITGTLLDNDWLLWSSVPLGLLTGAVSAWGCGLVAVHWLRTRGPELLNAVQP
ncbi:ABC-2 type transport system permease protein [Halopolyspora algeriensis]|uniref:ABC-2 type transport system permease protein n=1 Tax=Halopolyspora algeriensis TaxID=1500506 RepID=A0A368VKM4_9ACTN|nr:hypothetical protein [Halopolyspora algeriensis]RCW40837.1 ABC-2 type transport system permease protein [Halopolyspora algeriensis]TQM53245.1 ABC-2 type transport system permease protein [Halopolyspora algeriensis]